MDHVDIDDEVSDDYDERLLHLLPTSRHGSNFLTVASTEAVASVEAEEAKKELMMQCWR